MSESVSGGRAVGAGQGWTWIADGFALFKKQPGMWIGIFVVLVVILVVLRLIPLIGFVAFVLLAPVFTAGLMVGSQSVAREAPLEFGHLFAGFKRQTGNLLAVGALGVAGLGVVMLPVVAIVGTGVLIAAMQGDTAGFVAMGGSLALAALISMALLVPLSMALWFAPSLVILRGTAPVAAIQQSFMGCLKNMGPFLLYGIVMLVLAIVATIPFLLGWLVLGPVTIASVYVAYRDIYGDA